MKSLNTGFSLKAIKKLPLLIAVSLLIVIILICFFLFTYYPADKDALDAMRSDDRVTVTKTGFGYFFDGPSEDTGFIFYPGARVDETAYAPLMHSLAAEGTDTFIVSMPFRIPFFNRNGADEVLKQYSRSEWYIGGHSLGGVLASDYAAEHSDIFSGIILLASYPDRKIPDEMTEIQITGSEDGVINRDMLADSMKYAPENYIGYIIEGGNHTQFGSYPIQSGDGIAEISAQEQVRETVDVITDSTIRHTFP